MYAKITVDRIEDLVALTSQVSSKVAIFYSASSDGLTRTLTAANNLNVLYECRVANIEFDRWKSEEAVGDVSLYPGKIEFVA